MQEPNSQRGTRVEQARHNQQRALSLAVEHAGSCLTVWESPEHTGLGYSLVYPGFGLEAVKLAPPEAKGLAMGAFTAFLDLALGLASPALGLIATHAALDSVFLVSALVVLTAAFVAIRLLRARTLPTTSPAPNVKR